MTRYPGCTKSCPRGTWVGSKPLLPASASRPSAQPAPTTSFLSASLAFLDHPPPAPALLPSPLPLGPLWSHLAAGPRQRLAGQGGQPSWWRAGSGEQTLGGFIRLCWLGWGGGRPRSTPLASWPQGSRAGQVPISSPRPAAPSRSLWPSFCFGKAEPARGRGHVSATPGRGPRPLLHQLRGAARPEKGDRIPQIHSLLPSLSPG